MLRLVLLFTVIPLVELALLIKVGEKIGAVNTILIVVLTGTAGAALARAQGLGTLARIRESLSRGELPAIPLLDGVLILAAGLLLLTPGLITDAAGFLLLIPFTRARVKNRLLGRLRRMVERGDGRVVYFGPRG